MEICYLPTKSLDKNPDNFLRPLSKKEYEDLKESIRRYGIRDPLIVAPQGDGRYMIIAGNYRLDIAEDLKIELLPCIVVDETEIEGALDTEIFRRHLTAEEREKYISIKEQKCKEIIDKLFKERLIPEFYEKYKKGELDLGEAIQLSKIVIEKQAALVQSGFDDGEELRDSEADSENDVSYYENIIEQKEEELKKKEKELKELKEWKEKNEEKLESEIAKFKKMEDDATEKARKKVEKELKDRDNVNEKLRKQIRKKEEEVEGLKDEIKNIRAKERKKEIEKKAERIEELEFQRKYMVNIIVTNLEYALENIKKAKKLLKEPLCKRDFKEARERLNEIIKLSREMLSDMKERERGNQED